jgi:carbonic anhydrase
MWWNSRITPKSFIAIIIYLKKTDFNFALIAKFFPQLDDYADNPWTSYAKKVIKDKSTFTEKKNLYTLRELVQDDDFNILSYKGSLTNPDCQENVTWMVSTKPLTISSNDLAQLRKINDLQGLPLVKNFRPLQRINGRVITEYN